MDQVELKVEIGRYKSKIKTN